jgi:hypothetical protein
MSGGKTGAAALWARVSVMVRPSAWRLTRHSLRELLGQSRILGGVVSIQPGGMPLGRAWTGAAGFGERVRMVRRARRFIGEVYAWGVGVSRRLPGKLGDLLTEWELRCPRGRTLQKITSIIRTSEVYP